MNTKMSLFPITSDVNHHGHLTIGGVDCVDLALEFGTPLYVYDEFNLREMCREFQTQFKKQLNDVSVAFAGKTFLSKAFAELLNEEGMSLDVISAGEIAYAKAGGFDMKRAYLHGNNKRPSDIKVALQNGIGYIVVDGFDDLRNTNEVAASMGVKASILLRLAPNVDVHTHRFISTGQADSKFGFSLDIAKEACEKALTLSNIDLCGFHCHIGSLIMEIEPFVQTVRVMVSVCASAKNWGVNVRKLDLGGGYGIAYTEKDSFPTYEDYAKSVSEAIKEECQKNNIDVPSITVEPGRSIVGRAGVALYTVGNIKEIKGIRKYVSVDGGMGDNIRPALYDAQYSAAVANRMLDSEAEIISLAGPFCESSDIIIKDIAMPILNQGDVIAVPASGAYCLSMSSNYNGYCRPAVIFVQDGRARLVRRRETPDDLLKCEV